jgi:hypothetical protein
VQVCSMYNKVEICAPSPVMYETNNKKVMMA